MATWGRFPDEEAPKVVVALAEQVERDGGLALALYREPVGDHWHIFCLLPMDKVEPTPYQRDLSPTHAKRLQEVVTKIDRFVDPIVIMSPKPGLYWTPDGNHRARARGRLPDPRAQHGEGAQPQGEIPRGHRHVPGTRGRRAGERRGRLRLPVRGSPLHHPGTSLREEQALRGRRLRAHPPARRQVSEGALPEDARGAGGARRAGAGSRRGARGGGGQDQEARHQPSLREELRARPHDAP